MKIPALPVLAATLLAGCAATSAPRPDLAALKQQVTDTETAFAATMAARDHAAFVSFLAEETVWFSGKGVLRGKDAVAQDWKRFYEGPDAPFSWKPAEVEVLDSGTLAISSGPVFGPDGKQVAVYNSIWRLEAPGQWRIIFDKGGCACEPRK
jgi:ketosteroid isomerase-like protein